MITTHSNLPTLIERFYHWEKTMPNKIFLRQPKGKSWHTLTYFQAGQEARKMTAALRQKGLEKGDHIGLFSKNCCHWILADLAIMIGGFVSVPLYASLTKSQLAEVVKLGDLKAMFIGKLEAWGDRVEAIPTTVFPIKFPHYEGSANINIGVAWNDLIENAEPIRDHPIPKADTLWTIKFTSGTTGTPKGVMLAHLSPALTMINEEKTNNLGVFHLPKHQYLSYLPLNHIYERIGIEVSAIWMGGTISFVENLDSFLRNLQDTQPNLFLAVPRIWTKFYLGVIAQIPKRKLDFYLKIPILSRIVKKQLRKKLGLQNVKLATTGAAITPAYLKDFYKKIGIHLIEVYGMTETCGLMATSPNPDAPSDSVGKVIPFGALKIHPETGEVLMKTPYIMKGYYKSPEKTAEVLANGWMHTGDKGTIDKQGYLRIIGRVKDAFKTAKGSYVTPNPMEEVLVKNDYVEQVCVVGLGIPQPVALMNLSTIGKAENKEIVQKSILRSIHQVNTTRANYEKISTAIIQKEAWTIENELLTPTLKVKRANIDAKYQKDYLLWH
ncbi:MAG: AMP-binding protein, partial [Bacteroidota bacterium]